MAELIRRRSRYEAMFRGLPDPTDRVSSGYVRLALLGSLNRALTWFGQGGDTPEAVGRGPFTLFRADQPTFRPGL